MRIPSSSDIPGFLQHLSYMGIFLWFLLTQLIFIMPIPEEAVLLSIGYVAATGVWNPFVAAAVAFAALLVADAVFYVLSRSGNRYIARLVKRSKGGAFAKAEAQMRRNMPRTVFTLTFIPRVRFFGPVLAGALQLKWFAFFVADGSAQVIHTAMYVCLGYYFHRSLQALFKKMTIVHDAISIAAIVIIGVIVGVVVGKRWSAGKRGAEPTLSPP